MRPRVCRVIVSAVRASGGPSTIVEAEGTWRDPIGHRRAPVAFAGEHRAMRDIAEALQRGEHPVALVQPWQIVEGRTL